MLDFFDCLELHPGNLVNGLAFRDAYLEDNGDDDLELLPGECRELDLNLDLFLGMGEKISTKIFSLIFFSVSFLLGIY